MVRSARPLLLLPRALVLPGARRGAVPFSTSPLRAAACPRRPSVKSIRPPAQQRRQLRVLTEVRDKVKVLLVLYDGGQHAKDVSLPIAPPYSPGPDSQLWTVVCKTPVRCVPQ